MMPMLVWPHAATLSQASCQDDFLKKDKMLQKNAGPEGRRRIA
jgi:hypothetical protein